MATYAQVKKVRKDALRVIRATMRSLDSEQEKAERKIKALLRLRNRLPSKKDLQEIVTMMRTVDQRTNKLISDCERARVTFDKSYDIADMRAAPKVKK